MCLSFNSKLQVYFWFSWLAWVLVFLARLALGFPGSTGFWFSLARLALFLAPLALGFPGSPGFRFSWLAWLLVFLARLAFGFPGSPDVWDVLDCLGCLECLGCLGCLECWECLRGWECSEWSPFAFHLSGPGRTMECLGGPGRTIWTSMSILSGRAWPDNLDIHVHFVRAGQAGQFGHGCPFCPGGPGRTIWTSISILSGQIPSDPNPMSTRPGTKYPVRVSRTPMYT